VSAPQEITGAWEVQFGSEKVTFEKLDDWAARPEEKIRHYSGTAMYRKTFNSPLTTHHSRLFLDLGTVHGLATVRLNGRTLGTLWMAPWRLDVTEVLRPGSNKLEIEVVNTWHNRLVGDRALSAEKRETFVSKDTLGKNASLQRAGLLGPVTLRAARRL
jgi:hypothetical protein